VFTQIGGSGARTTQGSKPTEQIDGSKEGASGIDAKERDPGQQHSTQVAKTGRDIAEAGETVLEAINPADPINLAVGVGGKVVLVGVRASAGSTSMRALARKLSWSDADYNAAAAAGDAERMLLTSMRVPNAGGKITSFATERDEIFYRVYSGNSAKGAFLTRMPPSSRDMAIEGLALPPGNSAEYIQQVLVPGGTRLQRSRALPAFGRRGGMEQFELMDKIPDRSFQSGAPFQ